MKGMRPIAGCCRGLGCGCSLTLTWSWLEAGRTLESCSTTQRFATLLTSSTSHTASQRHST
ncbi:hypothetical protein E2C01_101123 [Portunus trituberculatus]|uniref:Secreted protein n=1 Tax=Portunus trituberculatus TaxID=210409 RepID=A0A5B7K9U3_PORTR|nr:hypothetical protein [Portunus trituberculatus]